MERQAKLEQAACSCVTHPLVWTIAGWPVPTHVQQQGTACRAALHMRVQPLPQPRRPLPNAALTPARKPGITGSCTSLLSTVGINISSEK